MASANGDSPNEGRSQIDAINKIEEYKEQGYKADDFVVMTKSKRKAKRAYEVVKEIIRGKLKLELHPEKTVNFGEVFVFLGFEFKNWRYKRPRKKSLEKFKDKVRKVTKRNQLWKVESIIKRLNAKIYSCVNTVTKTYSLRWDNE